MEGNACMHITIQYSSYSALLLYFVSLYCQSHTNRGSRRFRERDLFSRSQRRIQTRPEFS
jgi:hypothetical protein